MLRLGHRLVRDERTSTHIGLVSRAFGAEELILTGVEDETTESIRKVSESWGGEFRVSYSEAWRSLVRNWNGLVIHLTMYGEPIQDVLPRIRKKIRALNRQKILIVIGAAKVPGEIYKLADYNVAIGSQPHSEIAALAVFLDRIYRGKELYRTYAGAKVRVLPRSNGKRVEFISESSI